MNNLNIPPYKINIFESIRKALGYEPTSFVEEYSNLTIWYNNLISNNKKILNKKGKNYYIKRITINY